MSEISEKKVAAKYYKKFSEGVSLFVVWVKCLSTRAESMFHHEELEKQTKASSPLIKNCFGLL